MAKTKIIAALICCIAVLLCAATPLTLRDKVVEQYNSQLGVRENGNNAGAAVERYLRSIGLGPGYAWCAAFIHWNLVQCDLKPVTSGWAPAWFPQDRVIYKRGLKPLRSPMAGDVMGLWFPDKGRIAHVGFIDQWSDKTVITVEGNTNEAGSREGDGVYRKRRLTRQIYIASDWISK